MRYPPLRYYLERVLRDMGGISHRAAKCTGSHTTRIWRHGHADDEHPYRQKSSERRASRGNRLNDKSCGHRHGYQCVGWQASRCYVCHDESSAYRSLCARPSVGRMRQARKRHININFFVRLVLGRGTNPVKTWDKPRFSP